MRIISKRICLGLASLSFLIAGSTFAEESPLILNENGSTIVLEPYAPNIVRVTLSLQKDQAEAAPGFGFVAHPAGQDWSHQHTDAADIYRSSRMIVRVDASHPGGTPPRTIRDISKYFNGSTPGAHITITTPAGKKLLEMKGWSMSVPNYKDGNAGILHDRRPSDDQFYPGGRNFRFAG